MLEHRAKNRIKMMTNISDIERLLALEDIRMLKSRRDRACDTKDWALYRSLHADDHVSHNEGMDRWGSADEMIANVAKLLGPDKTTVHHSHTPDITFESATKAKGIWGMEDWIFDTASGELLIHGFGFYHETYEKRDGEWLFTSRQLRRTLMRSFPEEMKA
jgi:SnoaL-like domain